MASGKDHTALYVGIGILAFLVFRDTIQQTLVTAATAAGAAAGTTGGASAVNAAVGDIGTIANDVAKAFGN